MAPHSHWPLSQNEAKAETWKHAWVSRGFFHSRLSTFLRKGNRNNPWFASLTTILDRYLLTNSALLVSMTVSITYFILFTFYWAFTRGSPKLSLSRDQSVFVFRSKWKNGRLNLKVGSSIGWHLGKSRCPFHFIISSITWWFC